MLDEQMRQAKQKENYHSIRQNLDEQSQQKALVKKTNHDLNADYVKQFKEKVMRDEAKEKHEQEMLKQKNLEIQRI